LEKTPKIAVAVFLKLPVPGKVKTRLAATIGESEAAQLYSEMVGRLWTEALLPLDPQRFELVACCDPMGTKEQYQAAFPFLGKNFLRQQGRDLGERMANTFRTLNPGAGATIAGYRSTILVGTDCVSLRPRHFEETARALETNTLVLGPATDGGYYLIAAHTCHPELFRGVEWSTNTVLAHTKEKAKALGLAVKELEPLSDIDTWEDLRASDLKSGREKRT
jgi:rSAM/selenodomain-associated transferase 1